MRKDREAKIICELKTELDILALMIKGYCHQMVEQGEIDEELVFQCQLLRIKHKLVSLEHTQ